MQKTSCRYRLPFEHNVRTSQTNRPRNGSLDRRATVDIAVSAMLPKIFKISENRHSKILIDKKQFSDLQKNNAVNESAIRFDLNHESE